MFKFLSFFINLGLLAAFAIVLGVVYMSDQLPSVDSIKDMRLQTPLRVYTLDGKLIGQFGDKRRIPIKLDELPPLVVNSFIAVEDRRFLDHAGVDFRGLMRAAHHVITEGNRGQGGSTITMQLARNLFLSPQKTYVRKINEILLALQIEQQFSKKEILELYLNKIYLGQHAYGVGAAAEVYYGKTINELNLAEIAMIAGLPKAPSVLNPISNPEKARERRMHVLQSMLEEGYITTDEFNQANAAPIKTYYHAPQTEVSAPYAAEMVRQVLYHQLGEDAYTLGLQVYTTLSSELQLAANQALHNGLVQYDRRHGFRGITTKFNVSASQEENLENLYTLPAIESLTTAMVLSLNSAEATVLTRNGKTLYIPIRLLSWGSRDARALQIRPGTIVQLYPNENGELALAQKPIVEGALIALRPQDGAILALDGGFDFNSKNFNMVTQAQRQPGSNFKPFIYSAALDNGFTAASIINDAPIVFEDLGSQTIWRPQNNERKFYGPTRLRVGLIRSRNLVSIRVLEAVGVNNAIDYAARFGFNKPTMPPGLSLALGTNTVTPLQMARAYSVFANGGFLVTPYLIDHVRNDAGKVIESARPLFACEPCDRQEISQFFSHPLPKIIQAPRVIDAENAYIMSDMLRDVIQNGTAQQAKTLGRADIGGKTGTTQDQRDGWFSGFNPDVVAISWIGFDDNRSLREYGAQAALPTWINFMKVALANKPERYLDQPDDVIAVRIDPQSGLLAKPSQKNAIFELFTLDTIPAEHASAVDVEQEEEIDPVLNIQ